MNRTDIINLIIDKYGFTSYLEVGTQSGVNLNGVRCALKHGVDPDPQAQCDFRMSSDQFFNTCSWTYDIIFIDGLHHADQFIRDVVNSMNILNDGGIIVCHDCNPTSEAMQRVPMIQDVWTGDVWRGWGALKANGMQGFVVDTDYGVGVAPKAILSMVEPLDKDYQFLSRNRQEVLNLQTEEYFKRWLQSQT